MEPLKPLDFDTNTDCPASIVRSKSSERRWVVHISDIIEKELNHQIYLSSSIFIVPKFVSSPKPQDYTPQFLGLGPYHHFSQDLYDMERYKLVVARQTHHKFNSLVARISQFDLHIRACYHRRLDLDAGTLALIMAMDGLFLLKLLCSQVQTHNILLPLNDLIVVSRGKTLSNNAVLRDIVKLENQIPILVLKEILAIQCEGKSGLFVDDGDNDDLFGSILVGFCTEISPFNLKNHLPPKVVDCAHILDLLYNLILPEKLESFKSEPTIQHSSTDFNTSLKGFSYSKKFKNVFGLFVERLLNKLPLVGGLVSSMEEYWVEERKRTEDSIEDKTFLLEAGIMVPTASELFDAGVTFKPTSSIKMINFDAKTVTFFLPVIQLGANSEVILRNLVAYEAVAMPNSLIFTRYLHLMNSFIDTAKDVMILKDAKIVVSGIKKDHEIAVLFNGMMNNSIGMSPAKELDEAINGVNKYYEGRAKVKAKRMIKKYLYSSRRILIIIVVLMILGSMVLQSFCSVYNCPLLFGTIEIA